MDCCIHTHNLAQWRHEHNFYVPREQEGKNTLMVVSLTAVIMAIEIVAGIAFGSSALLADGWRWGPTSRPF
jgi:Co/Zn/Cd efflux system component